MCSHAAKKRKLTEKIADVLHLKRCANQLSIIFQFRLRKLGIFLLNFIYLMHPRLFFSLNKNILSGDLGQSRASYKFTLWLDLRPSWFENEKKSFRTFYFNFSNFLIWTFCTLAIKADVSPCNSLKSILTFSCTLNNTVTSSGDCTILEEVLGRLILNGEVYISGGGGG